jgi:hypothetical protein
MRLLSMSFPIWWVMNAVAMSACVMGIVVAASERSHSVRSVITVLACSFGIPILLIVGRRVSLRNVGYYATRGAVVGVPFACLFGLSAFDKTGHVESLLGGSILILLLIGWVSLVAAAFSSPRSFLPSSDRPSTIDHRPSEIPETVGERH